MRGSLAGTKGCTCFIGLSPDDQAQSADLDCTAGFGNFTTFVPMPLRANVAVGLIGSPDLTSSIDSGDTHLNGIFGGVFNAVLELGSASSEHPAPANGAKWVNYPMHARLEFPKQRLCNLLAVFEGRDCREPEYGFDIEEGALTFDGQCEAFYTRAESHWP